MAKTLIELSKAHQHFTSVAVDPAAHDRWVASGDRQCAEPRDRQHMAVAFGVKNQVVKAGGRELIMLDDVELVATLTDVPTEQWRLAREPAAWFQVHRMECLYGVPVVRKEGLVGGADVSVLPPTFVSKFPRLGKLALSMQWALSTAACCRRREWERGRKWLKTLFGGREGVLLGDHCVGAEILEERSRWEPSFYLLAPRDSIEQVWDRISGTIGLSDRTLPPVAYGFVSHVLEGRKHFAPMGGWIRFRKQEDGTTEVVLKSGEAERVLYLPPGMRRHVQDKQIVAAGDLIASADDTNEARTVGAKGHGAAWDVLRTRYDRMDMSWMVYRWFEWQVLSDEDESDICLIPGKYAAAAAASAETVMLDVTSSTKLEDNFFLVPPFPARLKGRFRFNLGEIGFDVRPKSPYFYPLRSEV